MDVGRPKATFRFYAELGDFLRPEQVGRTLDYPFNGNPSVKDAIEAHGIPHPEVALVLANDQPVDFGYQLVDGDRIAVYPVFTSLARESPTPLRPSLADPLRCVLDVNLGKLARWLRLLGFDTLYRNDYQDAEVVDLAHREGRVALTRDRRLLKHRAVVHGYWVRAVDPNEQIVEVVHRFRLAERIRPFHRCLKCNGLIRPVAKAEIVDRLPPLTRIHYDEFFRCLECDKLYWQGPHYARLLGELDAVVHAPLSASRA